MDLNPLQHPFQGSKTPHDFLSLYAEPNLNHSDSRSNPGNSMHLTTHDFLQPLERSSNNSSKENNSNGSGQGQEISSKNGESSVSTASAERVLPGGIGTYSITHISSYTNGKTDITVPNVNGMETKPEISRSPFTLWEERVDIADGLRIQESLAATNKDYLEKSGYWSTVRPKTELSFHGKSPFTLSSIETAQQMVTSTSNRQRPQGFVEMMKSFRGVSEDDEDEDEEFGDRIREKRKENMPQKGEQQQKVDGKGNEQKPNTPRSKHSATEQRRRSKINDRFQMLRELVPHSDQKRDKASFLLEVIEYIQLLQEKVRKYETAEQTWNQERKKTTVWDMCKKSSIGRDHGENSHIATGTHLEKHNELGESTGTIRKSNATNEESCSTSMEIHHNSQSHLTSNKPLIVPGYSSLKGEISSSFNRSIPLTLQMQHASYPPFGRGISNSNHSNGHATSDIHSFQGVNKVSVSKTPIVMSSKSVENPWSEWKSSQTSPTTQHDTICNGGTVIKDGEPLGKHGSKLEAHQSNVCFNSSSRMHHNIQQSETGILTRQSQPLSSVDQQSKIDLQSASGEELVIQGGMINVSSVYSQGLLDTLTQALQSSGLDLSQANISVQIDLGRRTSTRSTTNSKQQGQDHNVEGSSQNHQSQGHSRAADTNSESEQLKKRPKIEDN